MPLSVIEIHLAYSLTCKLLSYLPYCVNWSPRAWECVCICVSVTLLCVAKLIDICFSVAMWSWDYPLPHLLQGREWPWGPHPTTTTRTVKAAMVKCYCGWIIHTCDTCGLDGPVHLTSAFSVTDETIGDSFPLPTSPRSPRVSYVRLKHMLHVPRQYLSGSLEFSYQFLKIGYQLWKKFNFIPYVRGPVCKLEVSGTAIYNPRSLQWLLMWKAVQAAMCRDGNSLQCCKFPA